MNNEFFIYLTVASVFSIFTTSNPTPEPDCLPDLIEVEPKQEQKEIEQQCLLISCISEKYGVQNNWDRKKQAIVALQDTWHF